MTKLLKNANKPTSPFWGKVAMACAAASSFIAGYGLIANMKAFVIAGGILGVLGTVIPNLISGESNS